MKFYSEKLNSVSRLNSPTLLLLYALLLRFVGVLCNAIVIVVSQFDLIDDMAGFIVFRTVLTFTYSKSMDMESR